MKRPNRRKVVGTVVSCKMAKTVVVEVKRTLRHPIYEKVITRSNRVYAHHEGEPLAVGSTVNIVESRPLSKLKRWRTVV